MRYTPILGSILLLLACVGYGEQARQVSDAVVGMKARKVINCMGPPEDFDYEADDEDHAIWVYLRPLQERGPSVVLDRQGSSRRPELPPVTIGRSGQIEEDDPNDIRRGRQVEFGDDEEEFGYCQLSFEIDNGVVSGFEAVGRTSQGLNANTSCTLLARHCVQPPRAR